MGKSRLISRAYVLSMRCKTPESTKSLCHTGAHALGVCHHCGRRLPRDHARTRAPRLQRPLTPRCLCLEGTPKGVACPVTFRCPREPPDKMLATSAVVMCQSATRPLPLLAPAASLGCTGTRLESTVPGVSRGGGVSSAERWAPQEPFQPVVEALGWTRRCFRVVRKMGLTPEQYPV